MFLKFHIIRIFSKINPYIIIKNILIKNNYNSQINKF